MPFSAIFPDRRAFLEHFEVLFVGHGSPPPVEDLPSCLGGGGAINRRVGRP
jgi:hypothetical protein